MDLSKLTIGDIYAVKSEAKAKQAYFQSLQYAPELSPAEVTEVQAKADIWGARIAETDTELMKRINSL